MNQARPCAERDPWRDHVPGQCPWPRRNVTGPSLALASARKAVVVAAAAAGKGTSPRRRSRCAWGTTHHLAERPDSAVHVGLVRSLGRTLPRCAGKWPGRRSKAPRGPAALRSRRLARATGTEAPAGRARGSPFPPRMEGEAAASRRGCCRSGSAGGLIFQ